MIRRLRLRNLWPVVIVSVDLVFADANASAIQQLASGSLNMTVGSGLVDPLRAINQGADLAVARIEMPYLAYSLLANPKIKRIRDFVGKTISVGGAKDFTRIYLERVLQPN